MDDLELADIIDAGEIQELFENFYKVAPIPMFLVDLKGKVLGGVGWADICTRYHRVHPETCRNCVESDTKYSDGVPEGEYRIYKCKNNMWSAATPVFVGGEKLGNLFSGKFFFTDEDPDRALFQAQAARFGFPAEDYLACLERVPRLSRAVLDSAMTFYMKLARNISTSGWANVNLARSLAERDRATAELRTLNRTLTALSRSDQALVRATEKGPYLEEVCRIVVEDCGHAMAWIGFSQGDEGKTFQRAACAGVEEGRASHIELPLRAEGKAFGVLEVYSKEPNAFNEQEVRLLSRLADDLAYGVTSMRMRLAREQADAQFQQAQKMEAVGLMAGGIAHDFNNILAIIVGYNSFLLDGLRPGSALRSYSLEMERSLEVAATLTQQLLGVSGNRGAQRRVLDPNSVILAMAKLLRRLVGEKIRLALKLQSSVWPVSMDSGQLEQIVLNLAVNARDAMPKGGRLTLTTRNRLVKKRRCFSLEVRDSGSGMDAAVRARIFEPFFTTKGSGRGTGLGLSTVSSIVKEYAGHITVESEPGQGAAFTVALPSVKGGATGMLPGRPRKKAQRGHERILVVEDNASLLAIIEKVLRKAGYSVLSARAAEEALARCGKIEGRVDLLLSDVVLPDMDGPELAKRLNGLWPGLRTVHMSGYPGNALAPIAGFGGCVLLEKPFSPQRLLSLLREVLDARQGGLF